MVGTSTSTGNECDTDDGSVGVVIHTASSLNFGLAAPLINALSKQKEITGDETYFIHVRAVHFCYDQMLMM
jgi:hypothetical protein